MKSFLVTLALTLAVAASAADTFVYFGTYASKTSKGIYVSRLDDKSGKLSAPELAAETTNPCYLALAPGGKFLYSADSVKQFDGKNTGSVSAFAVDAATGKLTPLNQKSSGGAGPCHVSVDASGKFLFVANYSGGSVKSFLVNSNGSIGDDGAFIQHHGSSVNTNRQTSPHAHWIAADPGGRFALACDLGTDRVMIYTLNSTNAALAVQNPLSASAPPGSGPRHLAFSRDGKFAYVVNEILCTVSTYAWDAAKGTLELLETISALPKDVPAQTTFTAAEIVVRADGKFVYATVRGHESISAFAVDAKTGRLTFVENVSAKGKVPRGLGVDPSGRWLIVANQKTDNAVVFGLDAVTGKLTPTGQELQLGAPVDVEFAR
jgi:6-phosphogluconolactonase